MARYVKRVAGFLLFKMTKNDNGNTVKWRVRQLEENYERLDGKIEKILENHLPHLDARIQSLSTKVTVATVLNVGAIILAAVILKFL